MVLSRKLRIIVIAGLAIVAWIAFTLLVGAVGLALYEGLSHLVPLA